MQNKKKSPDEADLSVFYAVYKYIFCFLFFLIYFFGSFFVPK